MKNRGLIITLIILLIIIIIGLIAFLVLCLSGKFNIMNGFMNFGIKSKNIIYDEEFNLEEINNLEILSSAGSIDFQEGNDEKIRVVAYGQNSNDLKVNLNNNNLKIDYSEYKNNRFGFNVYVNDIIVYIPRNFSKEINIENRYGDCKIIDLENAIINIDADCGNIKIGKVKNAIIKCDYGDVDIETILNKCSIESNCGNIKIDKVQLNENSSIKSDYGDIKIKEINDIYVDAKVDLGDVKIENNNRYSEITLEIEADCGNIKVGK